MAERREIHHTKLIIPLASYGFNDGPFRDTYIRFGYDPRKNPEARFYQRVTFRYINPTYERRKAVAQGPRLREMPRQQQLLEQQFTFDGKTLQNEVGPGFQLCDITDPLIQTLINTTDLRTHCDISDGWYSEAAFDAIRLVTRKKLSGLVEEGRVVPDSECLELLEKRKVERSKDTKSRMRPTDGISEKAKNRRRNKAKGAYPAEEEAAARLRLAVKRQMAEGLVDADEGESDAEMQRASDSESDYDAGSKDG